MGLHIDIDQVYEDNMNKKATRKYGCVIVNQGGKLNQN